MQRAHTSILQNGHTIYFFRRIKKDNKSVMQMFSYNMIERKRQLLEEETQAYFKKHKEERIKLSVLKMMNGYCFEEEENLNRYIQFSQEISDCSYDSEVLSCDHSFLSKFYVIN